MRIAWIDHTLGLVVSSQLKIEVDKLGIELIGASSFSEFERKYGNINDYDGLLFHFSIPDLSYNGNKLRTLNVPIAMLNRSDREINEEDCFSYTNYQGIAEFFLQKQTKTVK